MASVKQESSLQSNMSNKRQCSSVDVLQKRLIELENKYATDDWDGHGSSKLSATSIRLAKASLNNFATVASIPFVTIDTRGEVCFEYGHLQSSFVMVKFRATDKILFLRSSADAKTVLDVQMTYDMLEGQKWLMMLPN